MSSPYLIEYIALSSKMLGTYMLVFNKQISMIRMPLVCVSRVSVHQMEILSSEALNVMNILIALAGSVSLWKL